MRALFIASTLAFWFAVGGFWAAAGRFAEVEETQPEPTQEASYSLDEVSRHDSADDCWMVIGGEVYDLTAYVPRHPSNPSLFLPWCGKEATRAYETKTRDRPHSPSADRLLTTYRIGTLAESR